MVAWDGMVVYMPDMNKCFLRLVFNELLLLFPINQLIKMELDDVSFTLIGRLIEAKSRSE